jgi:nicotinamidase-related amidase
MNSAIIFCTCILILVVLATAISQIVVKQNLGKTYRVALSFAPFLPTDIEYASSIDVAADSTAVIVLDPLEYYRDTFTNDAISRMSDLVKNAQSNGIPVIVTRWIRTRRFLDDIYDEKDSSSYFVPTQNEQLLAELDGVHWNLWLNTVYTDAFGPLYVENQRAENVLRQFLEKRDIRTLVIAGTWAEECVSQTAYTAAMFQLTPVLVAPAIGGYDLSVLTTIDNTRAHVVNAVHFVS